jgi:hypothetical protein
VTEPVPQPRPPRTFDEPVDPEDEARNILAGWALFAFALLIFGGAFAVALVYLALD